MNVIFASCAIAVAGWVSPQFQEPIAPTPEKSPAKASSPQASNSQTTGTRPVQANSGGGARPLSMPLPPTDPRAFCRDDLPLPPTMNDAGTLPSRGMAGTGPRRDASGQAENGGRRSQSQKAFSSYNVTPAVSPYMLLSSPTANGTISPYMAYVRPIQEQQRASQELDRAASNAGGGGDQPAPYPPVFQNYGTYFPNYDAGR